MQPGFRPDVLEKVIHLLSLFVFNLARRSVDIDLNYLGAEDREIIMCVIKAVLPTFSQSVYDSPSSLSLDKARSEPSKDSQIPE